MNRLFKAKVAEKLTYYSMTSAELAAAMRIGMRAYYNRLKEPERMTIGEFNRLSQKLKLSDDEQMKILKG